MDENHRQWADRCGVSACSVPGTVCAEKDRVVQAPAFLESGGHDRILITPINGQSRAVKAVPVGLERRSPDSQSDVWPGLHLQSKPALNLHQVPGLRTSLSRPLSSPSHWTDMTAILCPPASSCPRPSLFPFWGYRLRISLAKPN